MYGKVFAVFTIQKYTLLLLKCYIILTNTSSLLYVMFVLYFQKQNITETREFSVVFYISKIMQTATTFLCPETKEIENTVEEIITVSR